jgi:hypothetical protein
MLGQMMQQPLLISSLIVHAERHHPEREIVSRRVEGDIHRTTYKARWPARSRRMAKALAALGVKMATAWPRWPGTATATWSCTSASGLGRGAAHHQPAPAPRPDHLHRRPCRRPGAVLRHHLPAADRRRGRKHEDGEALGGDDRPRAHAGRPPRIPGLLCYEDLLDPTTTTTTWPELRREQRQLAVLHQRHHRQPQGRAVQPPLDRAAQRCRRAARRAELQRAPTSSCRWCRCSTSTPGACPTWRR